MPFIDIAANLCRVSLSLRLEDGVVGHVIIPSVLLRFLVFVTRRKCLELWMFRMLKIPPFGTLSKEIR